MKTFKVILGVLLTSQVIPVLCSMIFLLGGSNWEVGYLFG